MSLVWIKVDREAKQHSIYSDGLVVDNDTILCHDFQKTRLYKDFKLSILLGCIGSVSAMNFIYKYFFIKWKQQTNIQYYKENACRELTELFEVLGKYYKELYDTELDATVILSINGYLFYLKHVSNGRWICLETEENFICAGPAKSEALTLLYYNKYIEPQDLLNTVAKVTNTINTNLFKIEKISYE